MIRNIIFDWSGTLVDDLPAVLQATNYAFRRAGVPELTRDQFRAQFCLPFHHFYEQHVPHLPLAQLEPWFHDEFRRAQHLVTPLPHAQAFLEFCRTRSLRTFVLSSVHPDHYAAQAAQTGFGPFIDHPCVQVHDKRPRLLTLLAEHRLDPRETLFIGDMTHDLEAARAGGVWAVAVLTGYNDLAQLRAGAPDLLVEHLGELRSLLERCGLDLEASGLATDDPAAPRVVATVGALIANEAGQVLLVRTRKWSDRWGIPGGKMRYGETAEAALHREIAEETRLAITDVRLVLVQDCIQPPEFYRPAHFLLLNYTARCQGSPHVQLNDEAQAFQWISPADARHLDLNQPTRRLLEAVLALPPASARP